MAIMMGTNHSLLFLYEFYWIAHICMYLLKLDMDNGDE